MYLDHRVTVKIARVLNMIDSSALLLDNMGSVILPEGDSRSFNIPEALRLTPTEPLVYGGVTLIGTSDEQPVFVCLNGINDDVKKCARLCAELINVLMKEDLSQGNREQSLRLMLRGEIEAAEYESLAVEYDIPVKTNRCVLYFYFPEIEAETAIPLMKNSMENDKDMLTEVGRHSIAMVKVLESEDSFADIEEYAQAVENSFLTETGKHLLVGISEPHEDLLGMTEAYEEARTAINIGHVYHNTKKVFVYRNLLLERFLNEVAPEVGEGYNSKIFNRKSARLFNEEMLHTIEMFFDNSLNLSETARKLYIHRNTLVYRLEKIQRSIGLDLRNFDDAVTFKMMMLLGKNNGNRKFKI